MPTSDATRRWLQPLLPNQDWSTTHSPARPAPSDGSENTKPDPPAPRKKRAHVSSCVDVGEMVDSGFLCCNTLRCVESFVLGKGDVATLRAEQAQMGGMTGQGRSSFVHTKIPLLTPGRKKGAMSAGGQLVCTAFFRKAFHVSNNMMQGRKGNPGSPALKGSKRARFGTSSESKHACLGYIDRFSDMFGQLMPHLNATYLYLGSMKELYEDFAESRRTAGQSIPSYTYFTRVWRENRSHVKPKTGGDFMKCYHCTVYKDTRFGAPGIRPSTNPATLSAAKEAHILHLKGIELDRACLLRNEQRAMEAKADRDPLRNVSLQADAAGQIAFGLPMQGTLTHGTDRGYSERQKVMAVLVEGQFIDVFLTPQNLGGGCNLICTSLHHTFNRLFEMHVPAGTRPHITHLTLQVDNCVSENKNHILLGYLGALIAHGVIGAVEVHFMPVGHTHIKIDQVFSRFSTGCKHLNLFTRAQQAAAFSAAYTKLPVHTTTLRNLGNFKGILIPGVCVKKLHGMTKGRAFQLLKDGPMQVTVGMKQFMHDEAYTGLTGDGVFAGPPHELFVGSVPDVEEDAPPFQLKEVEEATLNKIQQRYDSVHPRLESLFPDDATTRAECIREMNASVKLLRETGTKAWDLPSLTRRAGQDDSSDGESSDSDNSDDERLNDSGALGNVLPDALPDGPVARGGSGGAARGLRLEVGWFAVFPLELSNPRSLVVGKILSVNSSAEHGDQVTVNWFAPVARKKCRRSKYGRGIWSQDFLKEGNRFTPDQGTESVKAVCFTFRSLLQSGKLPNSVWAAVEESVPYSSADESDSEVEDDEQEGRAGSDTGGGSGVVGLRSAPTAPPLATVTAPVPRPPTAVPAPRPPPAPGVPLTAAHYRPRRSGPT